MLSYRQTDDGLQIFNDNKHVGFVDESSMLNLFNKEGHSVPVQNIESRTEIRAIVQEWLNGGAFEHQKKATLTEVIHRHLMTEGLAFYDESQIKGMAQRIAVKVLKAN